MLLPNIQIKLIWTFNNKIDNIILPYDVRSFSKHPGVVNDKLNNLLKPTRKQDNWGGITNKINNLIINTYPGETNSDKSDKTQINHRHESNINYKICDIVK